MSKHNPKSCHNVGPYPILVLNGPNLAHIGLRQPEIYGHETLADVERSCHEAGAALGLDIRCHQSNREYELIDWIHEAREIAGGIVINPAAFTHTSVAILDALNTFEGPVIEVHIGNIHKREEFRHHSFVSLRADAVMAGFGIQGYSLALRRVATLLDEKIASAKKAGSIDTPADTAAVGSTEPSGSSQAGGDTGRSELSAVARSG